ncbi:3'-5' exoribonuclease domain-containing protein [Kiloniella sp.]|uniref:3'-5' exoribonuclease domain-containing protein n=1 Tax=Kiloniella sp. TaxID=1938587 RepID=UPI003B02A9AC
MRNRNHEFPDVMVDIETTDTMPDRGAIIQLAAVRFNLEKRTVDAKDMFDRCLKMPPTRRWGEDTRKWWSEQNQEVYRSITSRAEDPGLVMKDFCTWAYPQDSMRFWGKPTHFDFSFVASYCTDYGLHNPFHYRHANDMNSFLRGIYHPREVDEVDFQFEGDAHNAIHDVLNQIKYLFLHCDAVGK